MNIRFSRRLLFRFRRLRLGGRNVSFSNRRKRRPCPETLEDRSLLSPITVYPIPHVMSDPTQINLLQVTAGPDGNVWFPDLLNGTVDAVTPDGKFTQFSISNSSPNGGTAWGITRAHDGNLAFGYDSYIPAIGEMTTSGMVTLTPIPKTTQTPAPLAADMATAPDGSLWWIDFVDNAIGELDSAGVVHAFPLPTPGALDRDTGFGGNQINVGPDGNIWFAEGGASKIGRITPEGVLTEFPVPSAVGVAAVVAGPDGNLWFTDYEAGKIGVMPTGGQVLAEYPIPGVPGSK